MSINRPLRAREESPTLSNSGELHSSRVSPGSQAAQRGSLSARYWRLGWQSWQSDFVRQVGETYATQIALLAVGIVTTVMVTRGLGPEGRGFYAVAMTIGLLGTQVGNFGMPASNTYYLAQDRALLPQLLGNSLLVSLVGGLGAAIVWLMFFLHPKLAPVHGLLLVLGLAWIPLGLSYLLMQRLLLGLHDVRSYNKVELLNRLCALGLIGMAVFAGRVTPTTMVSANLLGLLASCLWAFSKLSPLISRLPWPSWKMLTDHFGVGFRAYLITAFGFLLVRIDLLMVKYLIGPEQTGYYSIAAAMADYLMMLPSVVGLILFPRLAALSNIEEKLKTAKKAAIGTAIILLPLLAVAAFSSTFLVRIVFGRAFLPAADAFIWLAPGIFTLGIETVIVQFLNSVGYPKVMIWIWSVSVLLNVTFNFWAIPRLGIKGASAVSSFSYSIGLIAVVIVVWRGLYAIPKQPVARISEEVTVI